MTDKNIKKENNSGKIFSGKIVSSKMKDTIVVLI